MQTIVTLWNSHILKLARTRPWLIGLILFSILLTLAGIMGYAFTPSKDKNDLIKVLDTSGIVIGLLSIAAGWPIALLAWARRKEAGIIFKDTPGIDVTIAKDTFQASLILASPFCQPEWHLRHIEPRRVEFIVTPKTLPKTQALFADYQIGEENSKFSCHFRPNKGQLELNNEEAYQLSPTKERCKRILRDILEEYPADQICVDITAGTAIMTVAAFQAAEELQITSIYLLGTTIINGNYMIDKNSLCEAGSAKTIIISDHRKNS